MPPSAIEVPYESPFPLPDYNDIGANLMKVARSYVVEHDKQNVLGFEAAFNDTITWSRASGAGLELPSLDEDDPFILASRTVKRPKTKPTSIGTRQSIVRTRSMVKSKQSGAVGMIQPQTSRPATSMLTRRIVTPKSSSNSSIRPATALSTTSKTSVLRRVEHPLKKLALTARKETSEEVVLRFAEDDLSKIDSDFQFPL